MWSGEGCGAGCGFPVLSDEERIVCGRPLSCLMCRMGKMGMWPGEGCGAGCGFPDVVDEEVKVCGRVILLLM